MVDGDDRHPREIAAASGRSLPEEDPSETAPFDDRMEQTIVFNPVVGALEFTEEGAILLCDKIKKDI